MASRKMTRRSFLGSVAFGAAGALLAACQPKPVTPQVVEVQKEVTRVVQNTPVPAKPTVAPAKIRFMDESEYGPEGYKVFTDTLIPKFEALNPGVKIQFEPATGDWIQKVTAAMAAGTAPDVLLAIGQWMEAGQLQPIETDVPAGDLADFYESQLAHFRLNGHLYLLPKYVSTIVLAYNKDLFDAAGVKYPDDNWTWAEFLAAAEKLTTSDASGKTTRWGYHVNFSFLQHWAWSNGGEWMDTDFMGKKILIDQPKTLEALKFNWDLLFTRKFSPGAQDAEGVGVWDSFQAGIIGFTEAHSWQMTDFMKRNNFKWDFALLPKAPTGKRVGHIFADGYGVYKSTKESAASVSFLRYITGPEAEREMCTSVLGLQPSRKSVASAWDTLSAGAKAGINVQAFSQMAKLARLDPYFKDHAKMMEIFRPIWQSIWVTGNRPLEDGVAEIVKRVNEYLASVS